EARSQQRMLLQRLQSMDAIHRHWADVALPDSTLDQILKLVDLFVSGRTPAPKGMLLHGPPGTGKTLIARKLARHAGCHFEALGVADLKAAHVGHTGPKVQALWQRCRAKAPAILFIDECESVFARRGGVDSDSFGAELVQTFLAEWDGFHEARSQVLVIG
ncbi:ATPase AAA, partial [Xanthomonas translucens DAR61454]